MYLDDLIHNRYDPVTYIIYKLVPSVENQKKILYRFAYTIFTRILHDIHDVFLDNTWR